MGRIKCDHIKLQLTLTTDNIKRLSLHLILNMIQVGILKTRSLISKYGSTCEVMSFLMSG